MFGAGQIQPRDGRRRISARRRYRFFGVNSWSYWIDLRPFHPGMVLRMTKLTHLDETGAARMVDVGEKPASERIARAGAVVHMEAATLELLAAGGHRKGDVLAVARVAGIQAAKRCWELIPLCHPLMLTAVSVDFTIDQPGSCLRVETVCKVRERTGVEMEALSAASVAALTVYDMCKAVDRGMRIDQLRLLEKQGGRSGSWQADDPVAS